MEVYNARGNMSDTRFAWDLFWASGLYKDDNFRDAGYLDTHTSTALKRVFAELGLNLNIK